MPPSAVSAITAGAFALALALLQAPHAAAVRVGIFADAACTQVNPVTGSVYIWYANECSGYTGQPTGTRPPGGYGVVTALRSQALTACSPTSITVGIWGPNPATDDFCVGGYDSTFTVTTTTCVANPDPMLPNTFLQILPLQTDGSQCLNTAGGLFSVRWWDDGACSHSTVPDPYLHRATYPGGPQHGCMMVNTPVGYDGQFQSPSGAIGANFVTISYNPALFGGAWTTDWYSGLDSQCATNPIQGGNYKLVGMTSRDCQNVAINFGALTMERAPPYATASIATPLATPAPSPSASPSFGAKAGSLGSGAATPVSFVNLSIGACLRLRRWRRC